MRITTLETYLEKRDDYVPGLKLIHSNNWYSIQINRNNYLGERQSFWLDIHLKP